MTDKEKLIKAERILTMAMSIIKDISNRGFFNIHKDLPALYDELVSYFHNNNNKE